jgi:uncharacterized protein (TIGR00296 family)
LEPQEVVKEARKVIELHFEGKDYEPKVSGRSGVFVTLKKDGELRGCIGLPLPTELSSGLKEAALAAMRDPRFPPLREEELPDITVEVTLLGPPEPLEGPEGLEIGRHGVMLQCRGLSGLLLPQVATEQGWSAEEFLDACCAKAGLPPGSWKDPGARVYRFEGEVYGEQ